MSTTKPGSALAWELNPEMAAWSTAAKTNAILADIFDQLQMINSKLYTLITRKPGKKPKPYPRPGNKGSSTRHIGKGALPTNEMREWIKSKQKKEVVKRGND